ncbi:MAG: FHA domain-containing protein [Planctomycetota bacterium]
MRVRLVISEDRFVTQRVSFRKCLVIGRDEGCDLRLVEPNISRRHCLLLIHEDLVMAIDLASSNGTQVNGKLLEPGTSVCLNHDDQIVVGGIEMRVSMSETDTFPPDPSPQDETSVMRVDEKQSPDVGRARNLNQRK